MYLKLLLFSKNNLNLYGILPVILISFCLNCETKTPPLGNQSPSSEKNKDSGKKEDSVSLEKADEPVSISGMYLACASVNQPPNGQNNAYLGCHLGDKKTNNRILLYQKAKSKKWSVDLPKDSGYTCSMIDHEKFKSFWNVIFVFTPKSSSLSGFHLFTTLPTDLKVGLITTGLDSAAGPNAIANFQPENTPSTGGGSWTLPYSITSTVQPEEEWYKTPIVTYDQDGREVITNLNPEPSVEEPQYTTSTGTEEENVFDDEDDTDDTTVSDE